MMVPRAEDLDNATVKSCTSYAECHVCLDARRDSEVCARYLIGVCSRGVWMLPCYPWLLCTSTIHALLTITYYVRSGKFHSASASTFMLLNDSWSRHSERTEDNSSSCVMSLQNRIERSMLLQYIHWNGLALIITMAARLLVVMKDKAVAPEKVKKVVEWVCNQNKYWQRCLQFLWLAD